jgi:hypothetical protein
MRGSTTHPAILQCTSLRGPSRPHKSSPSIVRPIQPIKKLASSRLNTLRKSFKKFSSSPSACAYALASPPPCPTSFPVPKVLIRSPWVRSVNAVVPTIGRLSFLPARTWNPPRPGTLSNCSGSSPAPATAAPHSHSRYLTQVSLFTPQF